MTLTSHKANLSSMLGWILGGPKIQPNMLDKLPLWLMKVAAEGANIQPNVN
jgi:hypothetical protein